MECREKFMILWDRKSRFQPRISTNLPIHCESFSRGSFSLLRTSWLKANCVPVHRCFRKQAKQRWLMAGSHTEVLRHTHAYTSWTHTHAHNGESDCDSVWIKGPRHLLLNLWQERGKRKAGWGRWDTLQRHLGRKGGSQMSLKDQAWRIWGTGGSPVNFLNFSVKQGSYL